MKIFYKKILDQSIQDEIAKKVLKAIKPNQASLSNMELKVGDVKIKGNYLLSGGHTFTILEVDGEFPEIDESAELMKLKKADLQKICKEQNIEFESDMNKATLVELILNNRGE